MDIFESIKKLQKKPEASRKRIAWTVVFIIMAIIVFIWFTAFNLPKMDTAEIKKAGAPLSSIKEDISNFYAPLEIYLKENFGKIF